jgi:phosphoesterase RecJ-like protein
MIAAADHERFRDLIRGASRIALTTHLNPDGDALGSQFSLASFLRSAGKHVRIVNDDPTPEILQFIEDPDHPAECYDPQVHDAFLAEAELVILVDNSAPDRLGRMEPRMRSLAGRTLCIDHHPSRGTPWAHHILDEGACATAVIIFELLAGCGFALDRRAAEALYVGLATDTGFFRFNSTNARGHGVAAELLRLGAQPARVYESIYERNSVAFTRLLGHALAGMELAAGGAVATVRIDRESVKRLAADDVDPCEIATALLATDGVRVALLFRELGDRRVKVSLRSKGVLDVHRLASEFGGGGHRNASGIVMAGDLDEVVRIVGRRTVEMLEQART